mmetsp:Transcript_38329/g.125381  ORF Transcript_38329/g.125381 Transcript_38329/m.125381 type:complete len:308 (-) Transcript_38329:145-1068(-)
MLLQVLFLALSPRIARPLAASRARLPLCGASDPSRNTEAMLMSVEVPDGMSGGMPLQVQTPAGLMQVLIPPEMRAGDAFQIQAPAAPQPVATPRLPTCQQSPPTAPPPSDPQPTSRQPATPTPPAAELQAPPLATAPPRNVPLPAPPPSPPLPSPSPVRTIAPPSAPRLAAAEASSTRLGGRLLGAGLGGYAGGALFAGLQRTGLTACTPFHPAGCSGLLEQQQQLGQQLGSTTQGGGPGLVLAALVFSLLGAALLESLATTEEAPLPDPLMGAAWGGLHTLARGPSKAVGGAAAWAIEAAREASPL